MAKLPITIYKELMKQQQTMDSLSLDEVYTTFGMCGYKVSTANKWLLNWASVGMLKFNRTTDNNPKGFTVTLGDFSDMSSYERLCKNTVWLPVKEVQCLRNGIGSESCKGIL